MFWKRYKKRLTLAAGAVILGIIVLFAFRIRINIDTGRTVMGLAALLFVYILFLWAKYLMEPKKQVTVITKVKLTSPPLLLKSVMTYKLKIENEHHIEEKGVERTVKTDEILLTFNSKDHPNIYEHCLYIVAQQAESSLGLAESKYPYAQIHKGPLLLPQELNKKD